MAFYFAFNIFLTFFLQMVILLHFGRFCNVEFAKSLLVGIAYMYNYIYFCTAI